MITISAIAVITLILQIFAFFVVLGISGMICLWPINDEPAGPIMKGVWVVANIISFALIFFHEVIFRYIQFVA